MGTPKRSSYNFFVQDFCANWKEQCPQEKFVLSEFSPILSWFWKVSIKQLYCFPCSNLLLTLYRTYLLLKKSHMRKWQRGTKFVSTMKCMLLKKKERSTCRNIGFLILLIFFLSLAFWAWLGFLTDFTCCFVFLRCLS